jgi:hypothetical protein
LRWPQFSRLAAYRSPQVLLPLTAAVVDMVAVDTLAVAADTAAEGTLPPPTLGAGMDPVDISWLDIRQVHASSLGMDPARVSPLVFPPVDSWRVDTAVISGTAAGGVTALAHAGPGRTSTANMCGPAIKEIAG